MAQPCQCCKVPPALRNALHGIITAARIAHPAWHFRLISPNGTPNDSSYLLLRRNDAHKAADALAPVQQDDPDVYVVLDQTSTDRKDNETAWSRVKCFSVMNEADQAMQDAVLERHAHREAARITRDVIAQALGLSAR